MNGKNKKRAFITSIVMLIISAIVLTSSTFAWFSLPGLTGGVEEMNVQLVSEDEEASGFQISANAEATGWTSYLTLDNIFNTDSSKSDPALDAYSGNYNMYPEFLNLSSSAFNSFGDHGYPDFFRARVYESPTSDPAYYTAKVEKITEVVGTDNEGVNKAGIIAFDVFFKCSKALTIDFSNTAVKDLDEADADDPTTAIRYAFVPMGTVASGTAASTSQNLQSAVASKVAIAEAESNKRSADGSAKGKNGTGHITTVPVINTSAVRATVKDRVVTEGTAAPQGKVFWSDDETKTFDLAAGITKLRVYIWAEGNDVDSRESIQTTKFSITLNFVVAGSDA